MSCLAQIINENEPTFYLNRAKCYKELGRFEEMAKDAQLAVDIDDQYVKAWIVLGEALVEGGKNDATLDRIDKGIQRLRKAFALCTSQKLRNFEQNIQKQILKALKIKFLKNQEVEQVEKVQSLH